MYECMHNNIVYIHNNIYRLAVEGGRYGVSQRQRQIRTDRWG